MSICYSPLGSSNSTTSCPKRPILPQGVLNPQELHQSTNMKEAATIQRSKATFTRHHTKDPFPLIGTIRGIKTLTFYYSIHPVTVYEIPWSPYASTKTEAYGLACLYMKEMTYFPIQGILFPYFIENDTIYYIYRDGTIQSGSLPDTVKMNYAYY